MTDEKGNSGADREDLVNALIDGELNEAQIRELTASVDDDRILARTIIEAFQLQQAMAAIPVQRAPARALMHRGRQLGCSAAGEHLAAAADDAREPCWVAEHERVWEHVLGDDAAHTDHAVCAQGHPGSDRAVTTDRGAVLDLGA